MYEIKKFRGYSRLVLLIDYFERIKFKNYNFYNNIFHTIIGNYYNCKLITFK